MAYNSLMKFIYPALLCLVLDAIISLAFVSSMVRFLHTRGKGPFEVADPNGGTFLLWGEPAHLLVDQGHTTNAAAGTAVVLVGIGGAFALYMEHVSRRRHGKSSPAFYTWVVMTFLSWLLTMAALIFTFVVTTITAHQSIDLDLASKNPSPTPYPDGEWTPESWYSAVADLPLVQQTDRVTLHHRLRTIVGWKYNLIPLLVLGFLLMALSVIETVRYRKASNQMYDARGRGRGSENYRGVLADGAL